MKSNKMGKVLAVLVVVAYCIFYLCACASCVYKKNATVVESVNGIVSVIDNDGEVWCYHGEAEEGTEVVLMMSTHGTANNIYDDEILTVY